MAEYTDNLKLFKPGTDDDLGVESSLDSNFTKIDTTLGDMLKDLDGKVWETAGARVNEYQKSLKASQGDINHLKKKRPNARLDHPFFASTAAKGAAGASPENTMVAFMYAIDMGFWGIKTNIRLSSDNHWVCFDGEDLSRTSNGKGTVESKTLSQLKALDVGSWYHAAYKDERMPTLAEFLEICTLGGVVPYIEIPNKVYTDTQIETLVTMIQNIHLEDVVVIMSPSLKVLQQVRYYTDFMALGYVIGAKIAFDKTHVNDTFNLNNAFLIADNSMITSTNMQYAKEKRIQVEAWTVTTNRVMRNLIKLGVRGALTRDIPFTRGY